MISICIPCYEMKGNGVKYLNKLYESIIVQKYTDYEIIISDHSQDKCIENFCVDKKINYFRNTYGRGSSSCNINNAIKFARGNVIKPMFQDDYFFSDNSLLNITKNVESGSMWGFSGFNHTNDEKNYHTFLFPKWNNNIVLGVNTCGCPSAMFTCNKEIKFDEKLIWLMDCDYYQQHYFKYGYPSVIYSTDICIRLGDHTVSSEVKEEVKNKEYNYIKQKWNI